MPRTSKASTPPSSKGTKRSPQTSSGRHNKRPAHESKESAVKRLFGLDEKADEQAATAFDIDDDASPSAAAELAPASAREENADAASPSDAAVVLTPEEVAELKGFDLTEKFGPCIGISRKQRWQRAELGGRDPPASVWRLLERIGDGDGANQSLFSQYGL